MSSCWVSQVGHSEAYLYAFRQVQASARTNNRVDAAGTKQAPELHPSLLPDTGPSKHFQIQARCTTKPLYLLHYTSCLSSVYAQASRVCAFRLMPCMCDAHLGEGEALVRLGHGLVTSAEPLAHHTTALTHQHDSPPPYWLDMCPEKRTVCTVITCTLVPFTAHSYSISNGGEPGLQGPIDALRVREAHKA